MIWLAVAVFGASTSAQQAAEGSRADSAPTVVVNKYCVSCHNQKLKTAGLALDGLNAEKPAEHAEIWERVIRKLRAGSMPPAGRPRPDRATYAAVASSLEREIDRAATADPNPGRSNAVHRLNRAEYRNAVHDLLGLDVDVAALLPGDDTADGGFDNNADVLSISTSHLERYMSAARKISRLATGIPPTGPFLETFNVPLFLIQDDRVSEDLPLGSRGGIAVRHYFPVDADYVIRVRLRRTYQDYVMGMGTPQQLEIRLDGELVKRFTVGGDTPGRPAPASYASAEFGDPEWEEFVLVKADAALELRLPIKAGPRVVTASFVRDMWEPVGIPQPRQRGSVLSNAELFMDNAAVGSLTIGGPYDTTGPGDTPSRREIFICRPQRTADEGPCARRIVNRLTRRAYRGTNTAADAELLLGFFDQGRRARGSFDAGIQFALERLLVDPKFLLRIERDPADANPGRTYQLSDLELASRLSFFLWNSIPDEALLDLAERRKLGDPTILEQQVRRMLSDGRATAALIDGFAAQWLNLRRVADVVADPEIYPDFDDNLLEAFRRETELFIASTLKDDRSVLDLLRADYTFVNERLARHYGIAGVYGNRFRRVAIPNPEQRGGLLAHGAVLAVTSYPTRTSPVLRGKWLLDNILGAPPPAPPPNVPVLPERGAGGRFASVRERLEQHRRDSVCASCHANMDPLGFALENFDGIGAWRTVDEGGVAVDASGSMPGGVSVDGLSGLRSFLLDRPDQFVHALTEKLLTYALGRSLEYYDQPSVRRIVSGAATQEYRWSAVILEIVQSPSFRMRRTPEVAASSTVARTGAASPESRDVPQTGREQR
jgi:mono/diheme cytochrome c family protein